MCFAEIAWYEGELSVFRDAYGIWSVYLGVILMAGAFLSVFYLRGFVKKKINVYVIAYLLTMLFLVIGTIFYHIADDKFSLFSREKWIQYPQRRISMYFDLKQSMVLENYTKENITELLGPPDKIDVDGTYIYDAGHNNHIFVKFKNNKVYSLFHIE